MQIHLGLATCEPVTSKHTRLRFAKLDALTNDLFVRFHPYCEAAGPS